MKKNISIFLKGFLIGTGKIIPGVSGSVLAISFGIYNRAIKSISSIDNIKKELPFILTLSSGILLSIILMSNFIILFLGTYYLPTMLLFIGLICGGITPFLKKEKNKFLSICSFLVIIIIDFFTIDNNNTTLNYIHIFLLGLLEAVTMIIPGISGTAILMMMGCYDFVMELFSNPLNHILSLIPFLLGMTFGVLMLVRVVSYLFDNYKTKMNSIILGFSIGTVIILALSLFKFNYNEMQVLIGIPLFFIGYKLATILESN